MAAAAIASILCSVPISLSLMGVRGSDMVQAAATGAKSIAELLTERSPGARSEAELTKTKTHQRALAKARRAAAPALHAPAPSQLAKALTPTPDLPIKLETPFAMLQMATPPLSAIVSPLPAGSPGSGPGSPVSGGGGVVTPSSPTQPDVVTSAVPEPRTWAMMLLGFALIGWRSRRGRDAPAGCTSRRRDRETA